jgi:hypothetical protein
MAYQGIGTGTTPNDNTGDSLLIGAVKVNSNFQEIYNALGDGSNINFNQTTTITAGNGLTGGGDLSANRTLNVGAGTGIDVAADTVAVDSTVVRTSRTITAGNGLTGGGALSANRTLNVGQGDGISVAANSVAVDSTVVRTSRTITAGNGLTGGGDLSANRTLNVGAGTGIDVAADTISINSSYRFPSGTRMLFQQTSAPTGWTKDTTSVDNRALRVVSGTAGSGGTTPFTDVFASRTVILPRHSHGIIEPGGGKGHSHGITDPGHVHSGVINDSGRTADGPGNPDDADYLRNTASATTGISINRSTTGIIIKNAGIAGASMDFAVQYIDVIIAQRN